MERIFYRTDLIDAYSGHPIFIFDTSHLPSPDVIDYDLFIPTLMQWVPQEPYILLLFSCGLNKINWVWGITFIKAFLSSPPSNSKASNIDNIHKIIAVHESWYVKSISSIFTNFLISKKKFSNITALIESMKTSKNRLVSCESLSELSNYVDITRLKISLNIYRHDYQITRSPILYLHCPTSPIINSSTTYSQTTNPIFYHHFYQIFHIVDMYADKVELMFHKPGKKLNTDILFYCMSRNQLLWINDWDLNCIASCFKRILTEVPISLLPVDMIPLPMNDTFQYTYDTFRGLMSVDDVNAVLLQIVNLCHRVAKSHTKTRHSSLSISKSLIHALTHQSISHSNKDSISIATRFLKNLIQHWPNIYPTYSSRFMTVQQVIDGEEMTDSTIDESYNMSHDISTRLSVSSDDEENEYVRHSITSEDLQIAKSNCDMQVDQVVQNLDTQQPPAIEASKLKNERAKPLQNRINNITSLTSPGKSSVKASSQFSKDPNASRSNGIKTFPAIQLQFPPQRYKFNQEKEKSEKDPIIQAEDKSVPVRKPVVRGRKVGELTRLFEERAEAMNILNSF